MTKKMVHYGDFRYGRLDRKIIMRGDVSYRNKGFLESDNVFCTDNLTAVPRPGSRLIMNFGTKETRVIPFSRGQNQQYLLALQPGEQHIYYVDQDGELAPTLANDVAQSQVPDDLTDNIDQGYTVTASPANTNAYKVFSVAGYGSQDIDNIKVECPTPFTIYAIEQLRGNFDTLSVTLTKSDNSTLTVQAWPEYAGSSKFVMPTGYDYSNVVSVQILSGIRISSSSSTGGGAISPGSSIHWGPSGPSSSSGWTLGGYIQSVRILGATPGAVATWNEPIYPIYELDYDQNNSYLFLAHHDIVPYVLSISGTFQFNSLSPTFPTEYDFTSMGNPARVACGQSRLWFANMEKEPTSIIASKIGYTITDFQYFKPDVQNDALMPDSALKFTPIEMKNRIEWILGGDSLALGSWDGTYKMFYGQNGVISATGAAIKQQNEDAASNVKPAWKDGKLVFTGISRDNLRMMDYNMYVNRQDSDDISRFHTELMGRIIKKTIIKKDASNDIYVLFEDGTAAMAHFYSKEDRGFFPFSVANAKIKDINVVKSDNGDRLYLTCFYNDNTWKLILVDEIERPNYPVEYDDGVEFQEDVARWVENKCPLDFKVYNETPLTFFPESPLYVSQIQHFNPAGHPGIIEQYGPYVVFLNNPVNGVTWDDLVGKTLFFEDTESLYDFYVKVYKVDGFVFGIPSNPDNPHWTNIVYSYGGYDYAFTAMNGFVGIDQISPAYPADYIHVFSDREYLGKFPCKDENGDPISTINLPKAAASVVYGLEYPIFFSLGNVSANVGLAKRRVSLIDFNTYGSWGLACGTESTEQLVQLYDPQSVYGLIPKAMTPWTHVKLVDAFVTEKTVIVAQTIPYPFEIMGISLLIEENDTETGM